MKETLRRTDKEITEIYHFGKSTTPDRPDQTWVNCLNLFCCWIYCLTTAVDFSLTEPIKYDRLQKYGFQ